MNKRALAEKVATYTQAQTRFGSGIRALRYKTYASAASRYVNAVADLALEGRTILDVGCGMGDLLPYIYAKTPTFRYTGCDITSPFLKVARTHFPDHSFVRRDYFSKPLPGKFDVIVTIGTLNSNFKGDVIGFRKKAIKQMFSRCREALSFDMLMGDRPTRYKDSEVYFANPMEILTYCRTLTDKVIFRQHYHPRNFTIVLVH